MGMFDYVECEMPLPGPRQPHTPNFQTKDFYCSLETYTIKADTSLEGPYGPMNFHGMLNFYTFEPAKKGGDINGKAWWFQYSAKYTDGKCVGIDCEEIYWQDRGGERHPVWPQPLPGGEK